MSIHQEGGNIVCKDKGISKHQEEGGDIVCKDKKEVFIGFNWVPQWHNIGEKATVTLHTTYIINDIHLLHQTIDSGTTNTC